MASAHVANVISLLSMLYETCLVTYYGVLRYAHMGTSYVNGAFRFLYGLFLQTISDLPDTTMGRITGVTYAVYMVSVVSFFIWLRCVLMAIYYLLVATFTVLAVSCSAIYGCLCRVYDRVAACRGRHDHATTTSPTPRRRRAKNRKSGRRDA